MITTAVLRDKKLFETIAADPSAITDHNAIARCIEIKAEIVSSDPFEHGERKLLNLGHTAGHAIEIASNFGISHGNAVAIGMMLAAEAGVRSGITSCECKEKIKAALKANNLPTTSAVDPEKLIEIMLKDKKRSGNTITLIVPREIGDCLRCETSVDKLSEFWCSASGK
jgi:3-dehydroquinate synthase